MGCSTRYLRNESRWEFVTLHRWRYVNNFSRALPGLLLHFVSLIKVQFLNLVVDFNDADFALVTLLLHHPLLEAHFMNNHPHLLVWASACWDQLIVFLILCRLTNSTHSRVKVKVIHHLVLLSWRVVLPNMGFHQRRFEIHIRMFRYFLVLKLLYDTTVGVVTPCKELTLRCYSSRMYESSWNTSDLAACQTCYEQRLVPIFKVVMSKLPIAVQAPRVKEPWHRCRQRVLPTASHKAYHNSLEYTADRGWGFLINDGEIIASNTLAKLPTLVSSPTI